MGFIGREFIVVRTGNKERMAFKGAHRGSWKFRTDGWMDG